MRDLVALSTTLLLAAACGDNLTGQTPGTDATTSVDASTDPDGPTPDAPPSFTPPTPVATPLSAAGPDQLLSASPGPDGSFYVAGWSAADVTAGTVRHVIVGKIKADGTPDTTFGTAGFLNTQVVYRGAVAEIDLVTLADGKLLVSATVPAAAVNAVDAADTDIALMRITAAGALDPTFSGDGIVTHNLNVSILNQAMPPAATGRDGVRALAVGAGGEIYIHGMQRGTGLQMGTATPRFDTEFVVAKFTAAGALDTTYGGGDGKHVVDIYLNNTHSTATPHALIVTETGAVVAGGYANAGLSAGPQAVLFRLTPAGAPDGDFADGGLYHDVVLATQTEVYNMVRHGDQIVTGGYGRNDGMINDFISLRFDLATGARDTTAWGNTSPKTGLTFFDPTPADDLAGSNCRNTVALPDGKTMLIGSSSRTVNADMMTPQVQDAVIAVIDADGDLDPAYGTGIITYPLGNDGLDQFWGGAVSGDNAIVVGWKGSRTQTAQTAADNDDAYIVVVPLE